MHNWKVVAPTKSSFDAISTIRPDKDYAVETIRKASEFARGFNNEPQQGVIWVIQPLEKGEDVGQAADATIARLYDIFKK